MSGVRRHRPTWGGVAVKAGKLFTLRKLEGPKEHVGVCELWSHEFGWELRLRIDGALRRSQVCREDREWRETADVWKDALLKAAWRSDDVLHG